jgi:peptidoglycan-associated lipoprotein
MNKAVVLLLIGSLVAVFALSGCGSKEEVVADITAEDPDIIDLGEIDTEEIPLAEIDDDTIYIEPLSREFADINFEYDQYRILDRDIPTLEAIAGWLMENPDSRVLIEGHCDERGTNEYNMALGEQRALAARRYLVTLGVDPDRLTTISYGEERPIAIGSNEEAWAENRRAHFAVSM